MTESKANPKVDAVFSKATKWREEFAALRTVVLGCGLALRADNALDDRNGFSYVAGMSKSGRPNDTAKDGNVPFEEALKKLETIVEAMESGDLPLETLLAKYEEGTRLSQICQSKLAEAELRIQQLEKTAAGEITLKPVPELAEEE